MDFRSTKAWNLAYWIIDSAVGPQNGIHSVQDIRTISLVERQTVAEGNMPAGQHPHTIVQLLERDCLAGRRADRQPADGGEKQYRDRPPKK